MKCYEVHNDTGSPTSTKIGWTLEKESNWLSKDDIEWHPRENCSYEIGGNTWQAAGAITKESQEQLKKLWVGLGAKKPLNKSHVLGGPYSQPWPDTIVDQAFVDAITEFDDRIYSFFEHDKVWDRAQHRPPWDGPFYYASICPIRPSHDHQRSQIVRSPDHELIERMRGSHFVVKQVFKASALLETPIWRDAETRNVMCTQEGKDALDRIGVPEWYFTPLEVYDDRH